jgi:hypothetical protein
MQQIPMSPVEIDHLEARRSRAAGGRGPQSDELIQFLLG